MASFNGTDLGPAVVFRQAENPVDWQMASYAGVDGVQMNRLGARGTTVLASGWLVGTDVPTLTGIEYSFLLMQRAGGLAILDMGLEGAGVNAVLMDFRQTSDIRIAPGFGYARGYEMRFFFPFGL